MPQVPRVCGGAGSQVDALFGSIPLPQLDLIPPLGFVDLRRGAASTVHGNEQTAATWSGHGFGRKIHRLEFHDLPFQFDGFGGHFESAGFPDQRLVIFPQSSLHQGRIRLGEGLSSKCGALEIRAQVAGGGDPCFEVDHRLGRGGQKVRRGGIRGSRSQRNDHGLFGRFFRQDLLLHRFPLVFHAEEILPAWIKGEGQDVIEVGLLIPADAFQLLRPASGFPQRDLGRDALACRTVQHLHQQTHFSGRHWNVITGITRRDIDRPHPVQSPVPDERKGEPRFLETAGINGMPRHLAHRLGCIAGKPTVIEPLGVRFGGSGKFPVPIPDFHPGVVSAEVGPHRRAHHPGRHSHRAAGVNQEDGKPAAGGHAALHAFEGALIGLPARGGIFYIDSAK